MKYIWDFFPNGNCCPMMLTPKLSIIISDKLQTRSGNATKV